ncbi:metallophosphoesterase [Halomarina oriensis]|uniref:Calcineurin-like phosphoesterase domain-containing protein n=1 Tax=Halomarina oriensis TaxID=671145 RepID=A0A6B0GQU6_9EURY|nr:metallophosphoesterase [Halomarina oriensis]MWG36451.1 hypothetical protein [Halomarina oriensis]
MTAPDADAFTEKQRRVMAVLGDTTQAMADTLGDGYDANAVKSHIFRINRKWPGPNPIRRTDDNRRVWVADTEPPTGDAPAVADDEDGDTADEDGPQYPDLSGVAVEGEPSEDALTERERYIVRQLQQGVGFEALAEDLGERPGVTEAYLRGLKADGWDVYIDETAELVAIEGDHTLRSSEHIGTRTRKANRWWQSRHNQLVREFKSLDTPTVTTDTTPGSEDWVLHLTDIHAGDRVRLPDGTDVYDKHVVADIVRYITEKSLELADYHGADYDNAYLLWGGDYLTGEGVYEGQFEDLDAWLDEQHDMLLDPLIEQVKAYSEQFDSVTVVGMPGNHAEDRASGTSRQANGDLILYKSIRNTVAKLREHGDELLENVGFELAEGSSYINFPLRDGRLKGHLRHGQNRRPQAETSKRKQQWLSTLITHEYSLAWMGHHHVSGVIPWDGPDIVVSGSPKPPGGFVERIAASAQPDPRQGPREIATCCSVADHGMTSRLAIKTHDFDYIEAAQKARD